MQLVKTVYPSRVLRNILQLLICIAWPTVGICCAYSAEPSGNEVAGPLPAAGGQVEFTYSQVSIFADSLAFDDATGEATATGHVKIVRNGQVITGDSLVINIAKQTGAMVPANALIQDVLLKAERIDIFADHLTAKNAALTTCNLEKPHYRIGARAVKVSIMRENNGAAPQRLEVTGAALQVGRRRLFSLPPFQLSLGGASGTGDKGYIPIPYPGYSRLDGAFLQYHWAHGWQGEKALLDIDWRATERRGMRAAAYTTYAIGKRNTLELTLSRREDLADRPIDVRSIDTGMSRVLISRRPDFGLHLGPHPIARALKWELLASTGQYYEIPTEVSTQRSAITGRLLLGPFPAGKKLKFRGAAAYRTSAYGDGEHGSIFYHRITAEITPAPRWDFALSLIGRNPTGSTPFRFDRIDFTHELAGELSLPAGKNWQVKLTDRYDLQRRKIRDMGVELTFRAHCLNFILDWRQNRDLFQIGIGLAGAKPQPEILSE